VDREAEEGGGAEPCQPTATRRWGCLPLGRSRERGSGAGAREPGMIPMRGPGAAGDRAAGGHTGVLAGRAVPPRPF
jgi:hypothetical protein